MNEVKDVLKNITILYIEDDEFIRNSVTKTLKLLCDNVISIKDCDNAYEVYNEQKPNIIISDILLNKISGIDFVKQIREEDKDIPIILLSAYSDTSYLLDAVKLHLVDYLIKPVDFESLYDTLKKATQYLIENSLLQVKITKDITYFISKRTVMQDAKDIQLSLNELSLLELLIKNKNRTVNTQEIKTLIWKDDYPSESAFKSLIYKLRKKIGKDTIISSSGFGFRIILEN